MLQAFATLLFPAYRRKVLELFLAQSAPPLHGREIARRTGLPAGTLNRELALLAGAGVLKAERRGNQLVYSVDTACPVLEELTSIVQKASRTGRRTPATLHAVHEPRAKYDVELDVPQARLKALCRKYRIRKLSVFGSAARGELGPESDVDLMIEFEPDNAPSLWDFPEMQEEFSKLFGGRRVDLVSPQVLDNAHRRKAILQDLKVLYAA